MKGATAAGSICVFAVRAHTRISCPFTWSLVHWVTHSLYSLSRLVFSPPQSALWTVCLHCRHASVCHSSCPFVSPVHFVRFLFQGVLGLSLLFLVMALHDLLIQAFFTSFHYMAKCLNFLGSGTPSNPWFPGLTRVHVGLSFCRSVTLVSHAKMAEPI